MVGSLTIDQFNYLADQTNDFAVNEKGEPVGEDGMMSAHPPSFVRNRLKDQQNQLLRYYNFAKNRYHSSENFKILKFRI